DEWMIDFNIEILTKKAKHFCKVYETEKSRWHGSPESKTKYKTKKEHATAIRNFVSREIKWTEELEAHLDRNTQLNFNTGNLRPHAYRPFIGRQIYYARGLTHRIYQNDSIFPISGKWNNLEIGFSGISSKKSFSTLAVNLLPSLDLLEKTQFAPRWRYDEKGNQADNITDWALELFQKQYPPKGGKRGRAISKETIFHYVYGALHDPVYREKYALNLKRDLPRIPFYPDFWQWSDWGHELMGLHIGYESIDPFPLKRKDVPDQKARDAGLPPKSLLKSEKEAGRIKLDSETTLSGIPKATWDYKLGNRSAIEWILDQHKEKRPKDPTIREKFNTYCFADYKGQVIALLGRIVTVSLQTVKITEAMKKIRRE
ncbi:MAG: DNA methyltransferase, partial [Chloroflexi bacterium]|nr:DNA methyltransferase [Chloroflexota bacterium]